METIVEFYPAHPQELKALFSAEVNEEDEQVFFEKLRGYPVADFSLHLLIPEDLDRLCQIVGHYHMHVPPVFRDLLREQIWYDGQSESLTIIAVRFVEALAGLNETELENIARDWSVPFQYQEHCIKTQHIRLLYSCRKLLRMW
jgi:hypothetical protein